MRKEGEEGVRKGGRRARKEGEEGGREIEGKEEEGGGRGSGESEREEKKIVKWKTGDTHCPHYPLHNDCCVHSSSHTQPQWSHRAGTSHMYGSCNTKYGHFDEIVSLNEGNSLITWLECAQECHHML